MSILALECASGDSLKSCFKGNANRVNGELYEKNSYPTIRNPVLLLLAPAGYYRKFSLWSHEIRYRMPY